MTGVILIGAGGHARVVIEILRRARQEIIAAVDADQRLHGKTLDGVSVIGDEKISAYAAGDVMLVNAVGNGAAIGTSGLALRRRIFEDFFARGYRFANVVSPDAVIATTARLDSACHIITGAILQPGVQVGANTIVNTGARIDHDCVIGAHCHVAPGAVLCGAVTVGDETHVGAGAVIVQGLTIGARAVIGAGAAVTADVAAGATVVGVPARQVERP